MLTTFQFILVFSGGYLCLKISSSFDFSLFAQKGEHNSAFNTQFLIEWSVKVNVTGVGQFRGQCIEGHGSAEAHLISLCALEFAPDSKL